MSACEGLKVVVRTGVGYDVIDTPALLREARTGRLLPGTGVLPLAELVAALPADVPLAIEAPCRATADLPALERATRAYQTLSALSLAGGSL